MSDLIKLTGLWKSEDKNGNLVLSGNLSGQARIVIFKNIHKDEDKHPDYVAYISKSEPPDSK